MSKVSVAQTWGSSLYGVWIRASTRIQSVPTLYHWTRRFLSTSGTAGDVDRIRAGPSPQVMTGPFKPTASTFEGS